MAFRSRRSRKRLFDGAGKRPNRASSTPRRSSGFSTRAASALTATSPRRGDGMRSPPSAAMPRPNSVSASSMRTGPAWTPTRRPPPGGTSARRRRATPMRKSRWRCCATAAGECHRTRRAPPRCWSRRPRAAIPGHTTTSRCICLKGRASPKTASWRKRICARRRSPATGRRWSRWRGCTATVLKRCNGGGRRPMPAIPKRSL